MLSRNPLMLEFSPLSILIGVLLSGPLACAFVWSFWNVLWKPSRQTLDFSGIQPVPDFEIWKTRPHLYRPWRSGKYNMIMGVRKMPEEDWLSMDSLYKHEQELRRRLLGENHAGVMQCLPAAEEACAEALECIVNFVIKRYPLQFQLLDEKRGYIHNAITDRTFKISAPYERHPLEVAAQLVMEDINLLLKGAGGDPQEYYLQASFSMAPAGWYIQERIGWPLWRIHAPVPMWTEKLQKKMQRFLRGLKVSNPVQRNNYFIQVNDAMFQPEPFADSLPSPPKIDDINIRQERQTLRRLPRTGAVLFMVRTYLTPIMELGEDKESLQALREAVNALPTAMARYKRRHVWGGVFEEWCRETLGDGGEKEREKKSVELMSIGKK